MFFSHIYNIYMCIFLHFEFRCKDRNKLGCLQEFPDKFARTALTFERSEDE